MIVTRGCVNAVCLVAAAVQCDVTCGGGGTQRRIVHCQLPSGDVLPDTSCAADLAPPPSQHCADHPCPQTTTTAATTVSTPPTTLPHTTTTTAAVSTHWTKSRWSPVSLAAAFLFTQSSSVARWLEIGEQVSKQTIYIAPKLKKRITE